MSDENRPRVAGDAGSPIASEARRQPDARDEEPRSNRRITSAEDGLAVWARTVAALLLAGVLVAAWLWPRS